MRRARRCARPPCAPCRPAARGTPPPAAAARDARPRAARAAAAVVLAAAMKATRRRRRGAADASRRPLFDALTATQCGREERSSVTGMLGAWSANQRMARALGGQLVSAMPPRRAASRRADRARSPRWIGAAQRGLTAGDRRQTAAVVLIEPRSQSSSGDHARRRRSLSARVKPRLAWDSMSPTTRGAPACRHVPNRKAIAVKAVLLDALDSSSCAAPKTSRCRRKSSIRERGGGSSATAPPRPRARRGSRVGAAACVVVVDRVQRGRCSAPSI